MNFAEPLQNGLYRIYDYKSGLAGLYNPDGSYHSGDYHLPRFYVQQLIATALSDRPF